MHTSAHITKLSVSKVVFLLDVFTLVPFSLSVECKVSSRAVGGQY